MERRREPQLEVRDPVLHGVLARLVEDPGDRVRVLHHGERDVEALQVRREVVAVDRALHHRSESREIDGLGNAGNLHVLLLGELEDSLWSRETVEVAVEVGLGQLLDDLEGERLLVRHENDGPSQNCVHRFKLNG